MDLNFEQINEKNISICNDLSEIQNRIKQLEDNKADKSEMKKLNPEKIKKELLDIIGKIKESIVSNSTQIQLHDGDIEDFKRKIDTLNKKTNEIQKKQGEKSNSGDLEKMQQLINSAVSQMREELLLMVQSLQEQLDKKDLEDDMLQYQQKIFQKIDEIVGALIKKLANKDDTKKALIYLEKKISELYLLINPDKEGANQIDGLLNKRPLFWSCVSCDKDLDQYQGKLGDYKNWKVFPPKETSPERMGRFGVGYAQMLNNRKLNIDKEKNQYQQHNNHESSQINTQINSQINTKNNFNNSQTTGFPEIHKQAGKEKYIYRNK